MNAIIAIYVYLSLRQPNFIFCKPCAKDKNYSQYLYQEYQCLFCYYSICHGIAGVIHKRNTSSLRLGTFRPMDLYRQVHALNDIWSNNLEWCIYNVCLDYFSTKHRQATCISSMWMASIYLLLKVTLQTCRTFYTLLKIFGIKIRYYHHRKIE